MAAVSSLNQLTLLEHLNFKVPMSNGEELIKRFFVRTLDCPECPRGRMQVCAPTRGPITPGTDKQMHVNLGLSQIHFEWCTGDGRAFTQPQKLEGSVTLEMKDLSKLRNTLEKQQKGGTQYTIHKDGIDVHDPFGITTWRCVQASDAQIAKVAQFGEVRPGGVGNVVAMSRLDMNCQTGVSKTIAKFYEDNFHVPVTAHENGNAITTNFGQVISFNERSDAPPPNAYEVEPNLWAIHMCFYIESFEGNANRLKSLFWVNPDYKIPPINDNVSTVQGALERKQFRMKHIGPKFIFEHEIRDTDHPLSPLRAKL